MPMLPFVFAGVATINGSAKPLYVVDGVQVGDNANFLNPSDIREY